MRILFFLQPGTNSRRIFQDMIRGFERAGHETLTMELAPIWRAYEAQPAQKAARMTEVTGQVRGFIEQRGVGLCVGMWGNALTTFMNSVQDGVPRTMFDLVGVPHLMFWLDAPHWAQGGSMLPHLGTPILSGPSARHLINNPATAAEMTEVMGFGRTIAAPYGVDEETFCPVGAIASAGAGAEAARAEYDLVACVGPGDPPPTALALRELESEDPDVGAIRAEAAGAVRERARAMGGQIGDASGGRFIAAMEALIGSQLAARHTAALTRARAIAAAGGEAGDGMKALLADPRAYVRATMEVRSIEAWERAFTVAYLSRRFRCAVFGDGDLSAWEFRGERLDSPAHEQQSAAYARGKIGLNVMRWQDDAGLNLKPMEIAGSGVACLCMQRAWMERSFVEGEEIAVFEGPRGAAEAARRLVEDERARAAIAAAGLARVRREHTWMVRAGEILRGMEIG